MVKKYFLDWIPQLARLIYRDQKAFLEGEAGLEAHKQYMILLSPEKFAMLTIRQIFYQIFNKVSAYKNSQGRSELLGKDDDIFEISIKDLTLDLVELISKQVFFQIELNFFKEKIAKKNYSKTLYKNQMENFILKLTEEVSKSNRNFSSQINTIFPRPMLVKVAGSLISYGGPDQRSTFWSSTPPTRAPTKMSLWRSSR